MKEKIEYEANQQLDSLLCQVSDCSFQQYQSSENLKYCSQCKIFICEICLQKHDDEHILKENAELNSSQDKLNVSINENATKVSQVDQLRTNQENTNQQNTEQIFKNDNLFQAKVKVENTDMDLKNIEFKAQQDNTQILDCFESDSESESDDDFVKQFSNKNNDSSSDDDDDMVKNFVFDPKLSSLKHEKLMFTPTTARTDNHSDTYSKNSFETNEIRSNERQNMSTSGFFKQSNNSSNESNSSDLSENASKKLNFNNFNQVNGNNIINHDEQSNTFINQHMLTPVQKILLQKGDYYDLLKQFYNENPKPKNVVSKKAAKTLVKKKRKAKEDLGALGDEIEDPLALQEDVSIPEKNEIEKGSLFGKIDPRNINELKNLSKKVFDEIKVESDAIFKEIKSHIHGVQYQRDQQDRINKYKKYAIEGMESYFHYLKDHFTIEYDKLKKCKKRDKLGKMMNKLLSMTDQFQYYKDAKEYINFLSKDFKAYFIQIKNQLQDVKTEGNDIPPSYKIVYENLYDIFESLISYISLNLPNQKCYNQFTQPIISIQNSKADILPVHYPSKKIIGLWNCRTSEIEEIKYGLLQYLEFQRYRNYSIVNDKDFVYFIGGQSYNEEKNTFNPSNKCFKMSIHSGEILQLSDMPQPKMKFGITLINYQIYIFGGLQTTEKHRSNTCEKYDVFSNTWKHLPNMGRNRVSPLVSQFVIQNPKNQINIYLFGGLEDRNNINYSIEIMDQKEETWINKIEKPFNCKSYIPKQLGFAMQINQEQILIFGGMKGRKQKPSCSMQIYNTSKNSISNLSLDSLPIGIFNEGYSGQPIIYNKSIYILNTQLSQYYPVLKQLEGVCNVIKIGNNQQELIYTHCF